MLAVDDGTATAALLTWYDRKRRDLPWRRRDDAYSIWLSEVMLQQTRVDTVVPYYERFLERFPDVEALAAASEEEVLAAWSGLGYYRRARYLHAAARQISARGEMPASAAQWRLLPGIGEYTAAAIASIAGGEVIPVLDGNVERVISRLCASAADPKKAASRRALAATAASLLEAARPGDSNQALMELGASVCSPRQPACDRCPLQPCCAAFAAGSPERFPRPRQRPATEKVRRGVFVARDATRYLLVRRPDEARLMAGFWELPWLDGMEAPGRAAALAAKYGGAWEIDGPVARVRHSITYRRFEIAVYSARRQPEEVAETSEPTPSRGWFQRDEIDELATSSLVRKVLRAYSPGE
jgi:A/G-specific adenine glycosylase